MVLRHRSTEEQINLEIIVNGLMDCRRASVVGKSASVVDGSDCGERLNFLTFIEIMARHLWIDEAGEKAITIYLMVQIWKAG